MLEKADSKQIHMANPPANPVDSELVEISKSVIRQGSKSFAFASMFFEPQEREGAWLLYSWCRLCDDAVDQAESKASALKKLEWLEAQTKLALRTEESLIHPAFLGLRVLKKNFDMPEELPLDLLAGMRMDVEGFRPKNLDDLVRYCYHVAGVVGLMMCYVMKVKDEKAHLHAIAFGNALQMTNILRDVNEDWQMGRIYLPLEWLEAEGIDPDHFDEFRFLWPKLAVKLSQYAEKRYQFGREGLHFLPWRCRLACRVAGRVYQEIGIEVSRRGAKAWDQRVVIPLTRKMVLSFREIISQIWEGLRR